MATLLYQGHASCRITSNDGMVIYLDPFAGDGYDLPADLILVSHEHSDHNQIQLVPQKAGCHTLRASDFLQNGVYLQHTFGSLSVRGIAAYNSNHSKDSCVGFLLHLDGRKIYFAADTSHTDVMKDLAQENLDWAFLPVDGVYNMSVQEASACAQEIHAVHSVPIHTKPGALFDETVAKQFQVPGRIILWPGNQQIL